MWGMPSRRRRLRNGACAVAPRWCRLRSRRDSRFDRATDRPGTRHLSRRGRAGRAARPRCSPETRKSSPSHGRHVRGRRQGRPRTKVIMGRGEPSPTRIRRVGRRCSSCFPSQTVEACLRGGRKSGRRSHISDWWVLPPTLEVSSGSNSSCSSTTATDSFTTRPAAQMAHTFQPIGRRCQQWQSWTRWRPTMPSTRW